MIIVQSTESVSVRNTLLIKLKQAEANWELISIILLALSSLEK